MDIRTLGRTGLRVSALGLGCGGYSKLGTSKGAGDENAVAVIKRALDLGINCIDTAEGYGTEIHLGKAIKDMLREGLVHAQRPVPAQRNSPATRRTLRAASSRA